MGCGSGAGWVCGGLRLRACDGQLKRPPPSNGVVARPRPRGRSGLGTRTHATGRCPRSTGAAPRVPSPARPHSPDQAAAPVDGGQQDNVKNCLPGERGPRRAAATRLGGDKTLCHQAGTVGSGRAGCARRGGHRGDCAEPRRVFACPALNDVTAAAWPLRSPACDKLQGPEKGVHLPQNRPAPLDTPPRRSSARFRTIPQRQLRAASRLPSWQTGWPRAVRSS